MTDQDNSKKKAKGEEKTVAKTRVATAKRATTTRKKSAAPATEEVVDAAPAAKSSTRKPRVSRTASTGKKAVALPPAEVSADVVQPAAEAVRPASGASQSDVRQEVRMTSPVESLPVPPSAVAEAPLPSAQEAKPVSAPLKKEPDGEIAPGFAAPETVGGGNDGAGGRRKRRRNRNRRGGGEGAQNGAAPQNVKINPEELQRSAWKIFLGEVTEEGLALMDDRTAAEASRRAFRVAEIFLLEAARRVQPPHQNSQFIEGEEPEEEA